MHEGKCPSSPIVTPTLFMIKNFLSRFGGRGAGNYMLTMGIFSFPSKVEFMRAKSIGYYMSYLNRIVSK